MSEMLTFKTYPVKGSDPGINRINFLHALHSLPGPFRVGQIEVKNHGVTQEEMREMGLEYQVLTHAWEKSDG
jgi:hypothetical protein